MGEYEDEEEEETLCLAEWYRIFTSEGFFVSSRHKVSQTHCGLPLGHEGLHSAWLGGYPREALIEW